MTAVAVKCKVCGVTIPMDTKYRLVLCNCQDTYIGVDGGADYVRFIGEHGQFSYVNSKGEEVQDDD